MDQHDATVSDAELCRVPGVGPELSAQLVVRTRRASPSSSVARMIVIGELDAHASSMIDLPCRRWITAVGDAAIDLSGVTLIDAAGTRLIEELCRTSTGVVGVARLNRTVRRAFSVVGVSPGSGAADRPAG